MAMTAAHKQALAQGRNDARAVKAYLESLQPRKRGRPVTPETLERRIKDLDRKIKAEENPLTRVQLVQQRLDAKQKLAATRDPRNDATLEAGFVKVAARYSTSKGISYAAWREVGVPPAVLKRAGVPRTRS